MTTAYDSELAKKLNVKRGMKVQLVGKPADVDLRGLEITDSSDADAVIVFVRTLRDVDEKSGSAVQAAKQDRVAWLVYPKGGQLGTDLNRDVLWKHMLQHGVRGVRQVAIDEIWSALRFRPRG